MSNDLVTGMLPVLGRSLEPGFNVFDVMHHGLHEKQISNVFTWLLEVEGSHRLGDAFMKILIDEVNRQKTGAEPLPDAGYWVRQEVNTAVADEPADIADMVLESDAAVLVVENYFTSDGHGHSYEGYLKYSRRDGRRGAVVLLCRDRDETLQTQGWKNAPVLTYSLLIERLRGVIDRDPGYRQRNPEAYSFIDQMSQKFSNGRGLVEEQDVVGFVVAMCATGEARRYQGKWQDVEAEKFANDLAVQARERFGEGRELLKRLKLQARLFAANVLKDQLNATFGPEYVQEVSARYAGIYEWTVNFEVPGGGTDFGECQLQLKFGPSAWFANEQDPNWRQTVAGASVDYSHLFITRAETREVRQSEVTIGEVLDGLDQSDRRLHDEIVRLLDGDGTIVSSES
ncbi:MAG: PD-(D/E)XK nuclease family protein [Micrococcaceae bacterium]|nr:PD-(D/E)XK nuclease family protein [Micrococcaceae bacterium]